MLHPIHLTRLSVGPRLTVEADTAQTPEAGACTVANDPSRRAYVLEAKLSPGAVLTGADLLAVTGGVEIVTIDWKEGPESVLLSLGLAARPRQAPAGTLQLTGRRLYSEADPPAAETPRPPRGGRPPAAPSALLQQLMRKTR